jgi:hypothetical protein
MNYSSHRHPHFFSHINGNAVLRRACSRRLLVTAILTVTDFLLQEYDPPNRH